MKILYDETLSLERPLLCFVRRMAESTMQVVYETCLTRIEKKKWRASSPTIAFRARARPRSAPLPPVARPSPRPSAQRRQSATEHDRVRCLLQNVLTHPTL